MPKKRQEAQRSLFIINNQNLFSNNYLLHKLPETNLWRDNATAAAEIFEKLKQSYHGIEHMNLGRGEERNLEERFIGPVLEALGYSYDVQPITQRGTRKKRPDYALFKSEDHLREARAHKDNFKRFFSSVLTILETKYWGRRLNDTDVDDTLDSRDPTAQTIKYLEDVHYHSGGKIDWAILTNGKVWRLFYYRASSYSSNYYEVNLEEIIQRNDVNAFQYFYLFFSKDAFIPDPHTGKTLLDQHLDGSEAYAKEVSDRLRELIFDRVFEDLATGFIHYRRTELGIKEETDQSRKEIFKGCLTLLYRLLFLLYAESRNLLPTDEKRTYYQKSLMKLKEDTVEAIGTIGLENMSRRSTDYWQRLITLFDIINRGDPTLNVPIYNGGLFQTPPESFLATHRLSDPFLAEAIRMLTVDESTAAAAGPARFIDYSSLDVRRLGDIYEGLLEFEIRIAKKDMALVKNDKGKVVWKVASSVKETKPLNIKKMGEVYIENSKHERKASGSYYTPHHIVDYIVKNTVGPIIKERFVCAEELLGEYNELLKEGKSKKADLEQLSEKIFDCIFSIKVLDPAMGSGHFLVHTVDYISDRVITFLARYPDNPIIERIYAMQEDILRGLKKQGIKIDDQRLRDKLTEINLIKRMVMKRCIYGVDLNEMAVELAKLSLWLHCFTLGAPLSFLDHHLKSGNSLIGATITDLEDALENELFAVDLGPLKKAMANMILVAGLPDATFTQVKESYDRYYEASSGLQGYRMLLDLYVAQYFGVSHAKELLTLAIGRIDLNNLRESFSRLSAKDQKAIEKVESVANERRFFHWEIEFPEVFYAQAGKGSKKGLDPGFTCVIGNPPYDVLSELEQGHDVDDEKEFFSDTTKYVPAVGSKLNLYRLFSALSLSLLEKGGMHSFIVPMALLADKQAKPLREYILTKNCFYTIEAFPQKDDPTNRVFEDAKLSTCIYVASKREPSVFNVRIHPGKDISDSSTSLNVHPTDIEKFDKDNLSIPSYPTMTSGDFSLALKLNKVSGGVTLQQFAPSQQGEVNLTSQKEFFTDSENGKVVLRGGHVNRYEFQEEPKQGEPVYLDVDKFLAAHGPDTKAFDHRYMRIGYQRGAAIDNWRRIIATVIRKENFCSDTINYIVRPKEYSLFAILALLNSSLWEWRFRLSSTNNHVNSYEIDSMPMPPMKFGMSEKGRKSSFERLMSYYRTGDLENLISNVEEHIEDGECDGIHDLLDHLASRLVTLNEEKNREAKGFLKWLQREIGCDIEELNGKTILRSYYEIDFVEFLDVLRRNSASLTVDPSSRKVQETIEKHFGESVAKIRPMILEARSADDLIDKIIFSLYKLTPAEAELVRKTLT